MYIVDSLQPAPHVINERDYVHGYRKWTIYEFVRYDAREQEREAENDHIEIEFKFIIGFIQVSNEMRLVAKHACVLKPNCSLGP